MVLRLIRDLPGNRAFLLPSLALFVTLRAWPQRREARTTRFRRPRRHRSSHAASRPSHPALHVRDDREAPLRRARDSRSEPWIAEKRKNNIFAKGAGQEEESILGALTRQLVTP